ncbi:MAG: ankyrin repeat domain-containing protein [Chlamydiota bacterium]
MMLSFEDVNKNHLPPQPEIEENTKKNRTVPKESSIDVIIASGKTITEGQNLSNKSCAKKDFTETQQITKPSPAELFIEQTKNKLGLFTRYNLKEYLPAAENPIKCIFNTVQLLSPTVLKVMIDVYGADRIKAAEERENTSWLRQLIPRVDSQEGFEMLTEIYETREEIAKVLKHDPNKGSIFTSLMNKQSSFLLTLIRLAKKLEPSQRAELLKSNSDGYGPLHGAVKNNNIENIRLLKEHFSTEELAHCFSRDNYDGYLLSPLDYAARNLEIDTLDAILDIYPPELLAEHLQPNESGYTPMSWAADYNRQNIIEKLATLYEGEALKETLKPIIDGNNLLHIVFKNVNLEAYKQIMITYSVEELHEALIQENANGQTPLHVLNHSAGWYHEAIFNELFIFFPPAILAQSLKSDRWGGSPIAQVANCKEQLQALTELLHYLDSDWDVVKSLGNDLATLIEKPEVVSCLKKIYGSINERICLLLISKFAYGTSFSPDNLKLLIELEAEEMQKHPMLNRVLDEQYKQTPHPYAELHDKLRESLSNGERQREQQLAWQEKLYLALSVSGAEDQQVTPLIPIFQRLQDLDAPEMRLFITESILRNKLMHNDSINAIAPWLKTCSNTRRPSIYLLTFSLFEKKGVKTELLDSLHQVMQKHYGYHENHSDGKVILRALLMLAQLKSLETEDYENLIASMIEEPVTTSLSISQIIGLKKEKKLRYEFITSSGKSLAAIATDCFHAMVPITESDDFLRNFNHFFGKRRSPESIITYASLAGQTAHSRKQLGEWVHSVFSGTFLKQRYSENNSVHLKKLYEIDPRLKVKIPTLCSKMGKQTVGKLIDKCLSKMNFPLDRSELDQTILKDGHIIDAKNRFPLLWKFLEEDREESEPLYDAKFFEKEVGKRKKAKDPKLNVEIAEIRFQQFLMKLCITKNEKAKETILRKVQKHMKELENFGKGVGREFTHDVEGALKTLEISKGVDTSQFEVFLTDDYWDVFRIGSDVPNSCQRVDGSFRQNRCLPGIVLDGRTFPVVVKRPRDASVVARRLLRIEIEQKRQRPALYLEKLYSCYQQEEIDMAIIAMAKLVSNHLTYPLYSEEMPSGKPTDVILESEGNAGGWFYSDASGGINNGRFEINHPTQIHDPIVTTLSTK